MSEHGLEMSMARVPREFLMGDSPAVQIAQELHVRLPHGEAHNDIVIAEHVERHGDTRTVEGLGMAVLTPGEIASEGKVVIGIDPELNGHSEQVREELTAYITRIARQNRMYSLDISTVQTEQVDVVLDGKSTGQKMKVYRPVYLRTVKL